jgi:hypothetical protein
MKREKNRGKQNCWGVDYWSVVTIVCWLIVYGVGIDTGWKIVYGMVNVMIIARRRGRAMPTLYV